METKQNTRERVLQTATRLFAERGYDGVTIRDVASAAEANVAAVNYHFGDKDGLYGEAFLTAHKEVERELVPFFSKGTSDSSLATLIERLWSLLNHSGRASWFGRLLIHELLKPTPVNEEIEQGWVGPMKAKLSEAIQTSGVDSEKASFASELVFNLCLIAYRDSQARTIPSSPNVKEMVRTFCLDGVKSIGS